MPGPLSSRPTPSHETLRRFLDIFGIMHQPTRCTCSFFAYSRLRSRYPSLLRFFISRFGNSNRSFVRRPLIALQTDIWISSWASGSLFWHLLVFPKRSLHCRLAPPMCCPPSISERHPTFLAYHLLRRISPNNKVRSPLYHVILFLLPHGADICM